MPDLTGPRFVPAGPDGAGAAASALPLAVSAALVGGYRWIEHALYETLGSWVAELPLAAVQVHLDAQSTRHAWHADLWAGRLPVLDGSDPDALTVPPPAAAAVIGVLAGSPDGLDAPTGGNLGALPRLAGLYRVVLPRLVVSYGRHLRMMAPVADAALIRAIRLVLADEIEDWQAGERLLQRLITRPHDVVAVHEIQQRLESTVVGHGVTSGLVEMVEGIPPA